MLLSRKPGGDTAETFAIRASLLRAVPPPSGVRGITLRHILPDVVGVTVHVVRWLFCAVLCQSVAGHCLARLQEKSETPRQNLVEFKSRILKMNKQELIKYLVRASLFVIVCRI